MFPAYWIIPKKTYDLFIQANESFPILGISTFSEKNEKLKNLSGTSQASEAVDHSHFL